MLLYIFTILGGDIAIMVFNIIFSREKYGFAVWQIILFSLLVMIELIAIDGFCAWFVLWRLPEKWFTYDKKIFQISKGRAKFLEALGIKKWKDKILELGMFTSFSKREIAKPDDIEYIERFIMECNNGACDHIINVFLGFVVIFLFPLKWIWCFAFPAACVNLVLNWLPFATLQYNNYRLLRLREVLIKKQQRKSKEEE